MYICPYSSTVTFKPKTNICNGINFGASQALGVSEPDPWLAPGTDIYMTLTWTHSALKPLGAKNCLDML